MYDVDSLANQAELIVSGFAVLRCGDLFKVANLNDAFGVAVFLPDGTLVETRMGEFELTIARKVFAESLEYEQVKSMPVLHAHGSANHFPTPPRRKH